MKPGFGGYLGRLAWISFLVQSGGDGLPPAGPVLFLCIRDLEPYNACRRSRNLFKRKGVGSLVHQMNWIVMEQ